MEATKLYTRLVDGKRRFCAEATIRPGVTVGVSAPTKTKAVRRLLAAVAEALGRKDNYV